MEIRWVISAGLCWHRPGRAEFPCRWLESPRSLPGCMATIRWCSGFYLCLLRVGESHCMWIGSEISITKLKYVFLIKICRIFKLIDFRILLFWNCFFPQNRIRNFYFKKWVSITRSLSWVLVAIAFCMPKWPLKKFKIWIRWSKLFFGKNFAKIMQGYLVEKFPIYK